MKTKILRIFLPLAVSAACIYLATRNVHWGEMKRIMAGAHLKFVFFGMILSCVTFWLRGIRWRIVLAPFQKIPVVRLVRWQIGGLLINNLLPLRLGEVARAYWAGHKTQIPKSGVLATIIVERLLDMVSIAFIAVFVMLLLAPGSAGGKLSPSRAIGVLAIFAGMVAALALAWRTLNSPAVDQKLAARLPARAYGLLRQFISGLQVIQSRQELLKLALLSPFIWAVDICVLTTVSRALELNLSWMQGAFVMVGLILGVMVPAAPGAAGTYEAGGVGALAILGFNATLGFSFILLLHTFQFLFVLALGIPVLIAEGFHPKAMLQEQTAEK